MAYYLLNLRKYYFIVKYIYYLLVLVGFSFSIDNFMSNGLQGNGMNNINFDQRTYQDVILESEIEKDTYLLGPGDKLHINIVTASQVINLNIPIVQYTSPTSKPRDRTAPEYRNSLVGCFGIKGNSKDAFIDAKTG